MRVVFTEIAQESRDRIIELLAIQWTFKEMNVFLNDIDILVKNLEDGRFAMYQNYSPQIRSALIGNKHVRVYFKNKNSKLIEILLFFDCREDPSKLFEYIK